MIALEPLTRENWRAALRVRVQPEAQAWVSSISPVAAMILAKSYVRPDGQVWHPFAVLHDDRIVGVLAVGVDPYDVQTAWLHHVLIDADEQGRGYGRAALAEVFAWLGREFPRLHRVGLCVLPDNAVAWRLYASLGFDEVGMTVDGQRILIRSMAE